MSERELKMLVRLDGTDIVVGRLWSRESQGRPSTSTFVYSDDWRRHPRRFELSPALPLAAGQQNVSRALPGAFTDCAPDKLGPDADAPWRAHEGREGGPQSSNAGRWIAWQAWMTRPAWGRCVSRTRTAPRFWNASWWARPWSLGCLKPDWHRDCGPRHGTATRLGRDPPPVSGARVRGQ